MILERVWPYVALAFAALVCLRLLARLVFATERIAVSRTEHRENRELRERVGRYSAR